ncbi:hypothetical protein Ocin01_16274 [Orchesella cincta]|uniref:F-box domain-containing protein n=1 Tax=Orchesella cincta TaxID=48709 RepID=A0A1D2MBM9_ORCCI|nr:hypothetical protein Ocin01_16274 [Orchesella cincta]
MSEEKPEDKFGAVEAEANRNIVARPGTPVEPPGEDPIPDLIPEIWCFIFQKLSTRDQLTVLNTDPAWNEMLKSQKTNILLPLVLPHLLKYLDRNEILTCRLINPDSKEEVDKTLQTIWTSPDESFKVVSEDNFHQKKLRGQVLGISEEYRFFSTTEKLDDFKTALSLTDHAFASSYNPFLVRGMSIDIDSGSRNLATGSIYDEDLCSFQSFLSQFGHHVWRLECNLDYNYGRQILGQGIQKMFWLLKHTPNLRVLEIISDFDPEEDPVRLKKAILLQAPNKLDQLVHLDISEMNADLIATQIMQPFRKQLTTFVCKGTWFEGMEVATLKSFLPKVTNLGVAGLYSGTLKKLAKIEWPVEMLYITEGDDPPDPDEVQIEYLFRSISLLRGTLKQFELLIDLDEFEMPESLHQALFEELTYLKMFVTRGENMKVGWFWAWVQATFSHVTEIQLQIQGPVQTYMEEAKIQFGKMPKLKKIVLLSEGEDDEKMGKAVILRPRPRYETSTRSRIGIWLAIGLGELDYCASGHIKIQLKMSQKTPEDKVGGVETEVGGSDGTSPGSSCVESPFPVLVPEVWCHIFEMLPRKDLVSVLNTKMQWNELLSSKKTKILFPLVLPHVVEYLERTDFLSCRLINKASKKAVDEVLQKTWSSSEETFKVHFEENFHRDDFRVEVEEISELYDFSETEQVNDFKTALNLTNDSSQNPFILRGIISDIDCEASDPVTRSIYDDDLRSVQTFLSQFGHHIWRLDCSLNSTTTPRLLKYGVLKMYYLLMYLPNLRVLKISSDFHSGQRSDGRLTQFPELNQLVHLDVSEMNAEMMATQFMLHYREQLTTFICSGRWFETMELDTLKCFLPNLTRLRVEQLYVNTLPKLSEVDWPVEFLQIDDPDASEQVQIKLLLRTIGNFRETLTQLELYVDLEKVTPPEICATDKWIFEVLPKLKMFITNGSNMKVGWFWDWVQSTFKYTKEIHLMVTEPFAVYEERSRSNSLFEQMPELEQIVLWYDNENEALGKSIIKRPRFTAEQNLQIDN